MGKLSKAAQAALDALDLPCPTRELETMFAPRVWTALDALHPDLSPSPFEPIMQVARHHAHAHGEIEGGYGSSLVRHFLKRCSQIETVVRLPSEARVALIELAAHGWIAGKWSWPCALGKTTESRRACISAVARLPRGARAELESWRLPIAFLLEYELPTVNARNIAQALVWAGCISAGDVIRDEQLASELGEKREQLVRNRSEALRYLCGIRTTYFRPLATERAS